MQSSSYRGFTATILRSRRLYLLLLLLCVAGSLRVLPLPHEALGGDEIFSRHMAMEPLPLAWQHIRADLVHPPLYYLLLRLSIRVWGGASASGLRLPSLVSGLLALPLLALLGTRLPGAKWCGYLAAGAMAVGRYHLFYSQEARSYAFYTVLVLLLLLWFGAVSERPQARKLWIVGALLMTALVYTHYVGGVFIALLVLAALLCRLPRATKTVVLGCGLSAFLLFLPWLWGEVGVYHAKHGVGGNLDWQGHPGFYDVRQVWATSLGIGNFRGATALVLLLAVGLSLAACTLVSRGIARRTPLVIAVALMGWLPPLLLFALSNPPLNLPLFALRHVLPATALLLLLCCYGLERIAQRWDAHSRLIAAAGSAGILLLAATPTWTVLHAGPTRYPYDEVEKAVVAGESHGTVAYAAWFYGEGEPVNLYCGRACVQALPDAPKDLPGHFLLLYRPASGDELTLYRGLLRAGFVNAGQRYYTDGQGTAYGTIVVKLERGAHSIPSSPPVAVMLSSTQETHGRRTGIHHRAAQRTAAG